MLVVGGAGPIEVGHALDVGAHAGHPGRGGDVLRGALGQVLAALGQDDDVGVAHRGAGGGGELGGEGVGDDEGEGDQGRAQGHRHQGGGGAAGVEQGGHVSAPPSGPGRGARGRGEELGSRKSSPCSVHSTDSTHGRSGPRAGGMRRKTACRLRLRLKGDASAARPGRDRVRSCRSCRSCRSHRPSARLPRGESGRGPGSDAPSIGEPRPGGVGPWPADAGRACRWAPPRGGVASVLGALRRRGSEPRLPGASSSRRSCSRLPSTMPPPPGCRFGDVSWARIVRGGPARIELGWIPSRWARMAQGGVDSVALGSHYASRAGRVP